MNLSLEDGINSGIYRTAFSHVNGIPEIREVDDEYSIRKICDKLIKEDGIQDIPTRTYFPTIDEFLEAWTGNLDLKCFTLIGNPQQSFLRSVIIKE